MGAEQNVQAGNVGSENARLLLGAGLVRDDLLGEGGGDVEEGDAELDL